MSQEEYNRMQMEQWEEGLQLGLLGEWLEILALAGLDEAEANMISFFYSTPCFKQY